MYEKSLCYEGAETKKTSTRCIAAHDSDSARTAAARQTTK